MGLDSFLERFPRVNGMTPANFNAVTSYCGYKEYLKKNDDYEGTFENWCGGLSNYLPKNKTLLARVERLISTRYYDWDKEKKYPYSSISEQVGYWRKANAIHSWFVDTVQNGEDDCNYHREVTKEDLEELLKTCMLVLTSLNLEESSVVNGYTIDESGVRIPNYEDGLISTTPELAEELLPSCSGFFFGNTEYNEYYVDDLLNTIDICRNVLSTTNFDTHSIYYISSW